MITIVLADDEKLIRAGLKKILEENLDIPLEIIEAKNGEEALELCFQKRPALLITDIRMPVMDGVELMKKVSSMKDKKLSDYRADKIGFMFQFYNLIPSLTAYENVALTKSIVKDALDPMDMLERVGLGNHAKKFPSQMSGGEQQRVSIARALAKNPKIILGDEPTGALDSETGVSVLKLLVEMSHTYGNTVIVVTHNADIAKCADKVIRMKNGKIREIKINEAPVPVEEVEW